MKLIKNILILASALSLTTACNDLDLSPEDYYGSGNFWKTEAQAKGYMIGLHSQFRANYANYWILGEARGGHLESKTTSLGQAVNYSNIKSQTITKDNTGVSNWVGFYAYILNINLAIKQLSEASYLSANDKNYLLGQAYGLRAWYYFMLYRTYGGVPINNETKVIDKLPDSGIELYNARKTPKETLDFIKSDIEESEKHFGNIATLNKAQWSIFATKMLKAEIYLWSAKVTTGDQTPGANDLATAKDALDFVVNSGKFQLLSDFSSVFSTSNKQNAEIIFTMPFVENEATNHFNTFLYNPSDFNSRYDTNGNIINTNDPLNIASGAGIFRNEYVYDFFQSFDSDDTRRVATFYDFYGSATKDNPGIVLVKFIGSINSAAKRIFDSDIPVYRYSDALLMLAEVVNKQGGDPSQYINQVRKRAYGSAYASHTYTNASFAENELAILKERDKEFVAEGKRWFDVIRMQDASGQPLVFSVSANYASTTDPILNKASEAHKVLWPVNIAVYNADPTITQTPGYGDF